MRRFSGIAVIFGFPLLCGIALAPSRTQAQTTSAGSAQGYPARPIRVIVPNTAGSAMDTVARMIGQRLTEAWGQQIVVDARPGAGGIIGHEIAAKAAPDGYTLLFAASAGVVINPLLSGQVQFAFASIPTSMPFVKSGRLRALAQGGSTRSPVILQVPTVAETLPGFQAVTWYALFVPRATPLAIVARLNAEVVKILADPPLARWLADQGLDIAPGSPAALTAYMRSETERFSHIIKVAKLATAQ